MFRVTSYADYDESFKPEDLRDAITRLTGRTGIFTQAIVDPKNRQDAILYYAQYFENKGMWSKQNILWNLPNTIANNGSIANILRIFGGEDRENDVFGFYFPYDPQKSTKDGDIQTLQDDANIPLRYYPKFQIVRKWFFDILPYTLYINKGLDNPKAVTIFLSCDVLINILNNIENETPSRYDDRKWPDVFSRAQSSDWDDFTVTRDPKGPWVTLYPNGKLRMDTLFQVDISVLRQKYDGNVAKGEQIVKDTRREVKVIEDDNARLIAANRADPKIALNVAKSQQFLQDTQVKLDDIKAENKKILAKIVDKVKDKPQEPVPPTTSLTQNECIARTQQVERELKVEKLKFLIEKAKNNLLEAEVKRKRKSSEAVRKTPVRTVKRARRSKK